MSELAIPRSTTKLVEGWQRMKSRLATVREETEEQVMNLARTGEVGITAGGLGLVNGYFNNPSIGPVPLDFAVGGGLKLVSFVAGKKLSSHVSSLADGAFAAFLVRKATDAGVKASADANDSTVAVILANRANGLNDDGTHAGAEGDHAGADAPAPD